MKQVEKIIANNKEIFYLDFSGLRTKEEIIKQTEIFGQFVRKHPFRSVTTLTNLEGMYFNTEIYNAFAAYVKANTPYVKESAVIGMKGLMEVFYRGFVTLTGRNVKVCSSMSEAMLALTGTASYRFVNEKAAPKLEQLR
jgi:hypothetical protein